MSGYSSLVNFPPVISRRPPYVKQLPLVPPLSFYLDPTGGDPHTTLPPEFQPPSGPIRNWFRGNFGGLTIDPAKLPSTTIPIAPGANTTPSNCFMSFLLPEYKQFGTPWIDAQLFDAAEKGLTHWLLARGQFDSAGFSQQDMADLVDYVQSWGFYTPFWATGSGDSRGGNYASVQNLIEPYLTTLLSSSKRADNLIYMPGEELNNGTTPGLAGLDDWLQKIGPRCRAQGVPVLLHLTSNYDCWPGGDNPAYNGGGDQVGWWRWLKSLGISGLGWQGDFTEAFAGQIGLMGAHAWDARNLLATADPSLLWVAFELTAEAQLLGLQFPLPSYANWQALGLPFPDPELSGDLVSYQVMCCPIAPGSPARGVDGYMNGGRMPDGSFI
jgi:hypothetical protein